MNRLNYTHILLLAAGALLLAVVYYFFLRQPSGAPPLPEQAPLTLAQSDDVLKNVLREFSLSDSLLREKKAKKSRKILCARRVEIPANIPLSLFLLDVSEGFRKSSKAIRFFSSGTAEEASCLINTAEGIVQYEFTVSKNMRAVFPIHFCLNDFTGIDDSSKADYLEKNSPLSIILPPDLKSPLVLPLLRNYGVTHLIRLSDDIEEPTFRIDAGLPRKTVTASAHALLAAFPAASCFLLNSSSESRQTESYPVVQRIFEKAGKKVLDEQSMRILPEFGDSTDALEYFLKLPRNNPQQSLLFETTVSNYAKVRAAMPQLWKKGFETVPLQFTSGLTAAPQQSQR